MGRSILIRLTTEDTLLYILTSAKVPQGVLKSTTINFCVVKTLCDNIVHVVKFSWSGVTKEPALEL